MTQINQTVVAFAYGNKPAILLPCNTVSLDGGENHKSTALVLRMLWEKHQQKSLLYVCENQLPCSFGITIMSGDNWRRVAVRGFIQSNSIAVDNGLVFSDVLVAVVDILWY